MQIRRVKDYDGGNHLIGDELQFRTSAGEAWRTVEVINSNEAIARDSAEGIDKNQHIIDEIENREHWCPAAETSVKTVSQLCAFVAESWILAEDLIDKVKKHPQRIEITPLMLGHREIKGFTLDTQMYYTVTPDR